MPLAAIPANLLAGPVAGAAMVYGMAGGLLAGVLAELVGPGPAGLVHLPTRVMLWWLAAVARRAAAMPLGQVGFPLSLARAAGTALAGGWLAARGARRRRATVGVVAPGSEVPP